jgi:hypothetical protein
VSEKSSFDVGIFQQGKSATERFSFVTHYREWDASIVLIIVYAGGGEIERRWKPQREKGEVNMQTEIRERRCRFRRRSLLEGETANVAVYCLPTQENELPFSENKRC